jgi:hypothetical protein
LFSKRSVIDSEAVKKKRSLSIAQKEKIKREVDQQLSKLVSETCLESASEFKAIAESWAEGRRKADNYISERKGKERVAAIEEVNQKMGQQVERHLELVDKTSRTRDRARERVITEYSLQNDESGFKELSLLRGAITSYVLTISAQVGWLNSDASSTELESIMVGECLVSNR